MAERCDISDAAHPLASAMTPLTKCDQTWSNVGALPPVARGAEISIGGEAAGRPLAECAGRLFPWSWELPFASLMCGMALRLDVILVLRPEEGGEALGRSSAEPPPLTDHALGLE